MANERGRSPVPDEAPDPIGKVVSAVSALVEEPPVEELRKDTKGDPVRKRPKGFLKVLGPGLITGASDDDPSGIGTYSQAGSQFGFGTLWLALFTFPLMVAVQEACARIALETGVGLGTSLRRKFSGLLVGVCILAAFIANTINVGADLGAVAAGGALLSRGHVSPAWLVVPAGVLIGIMQ